MTRKIFITLCLLCLHLVLFASKSVEFTADAPKAVVVGTPFQLVYSINQKGKDLRAPVLKNFEIIAGPYTSQSSQVSFINGKTSNVFKISYTYTLIAKMEGSYAIPGATIVVNRKKVRSNGLNIKVLPPDTKQEDSSKDGVTSSQRISDDNLFMRAIPSRTKVYDNEAIVVTYRLYTVLNLVGVPKMQCPDFKGFVVHEIELPQHKQWTIEHYKGRNYKVLDWRKVLLFPQSAGKYKIEPFTGEGVVQIRTSKSSGGSSVFDSFYDLYEEVHKDIKSNALTFTVKELPQEEPADFAGGVGQFTLESSISAQELNQNESLTLKLKLKGKGNLKLMQLPKIKFPADFEVYDPKISTKITNTEAGQTGSKTIEYLVIPRHNGDFEIPSIDFSYFDPVSKSYKSLHSQSYRLKVNKGVNEDANQAGVVTPSYTNQQDVEELGSDIRYIHTQLDTIEVSVEPIAGSGKFWLLYGIPLFIAVLLLIFFRKQARENADIALSRNKRANKLARKRLKLADKAMKLQNKAEFYDELLTALWGYLCDKLNMPLADLNKENVAAQLESHKVKDTLIKEFIELLNQCEFERYAPMQDTQSAMDSIFAKTLKMITQLDQSIKK